MAAGKADQQRQSEALHQARLREAARCEALNDIRDAQSLRLFALKQDVEEGLSRLPAPGSLAEMVLIPGNNPRLWVDIIGSVAMGSDPRAYRFELEREGGRETLLETCDRAEMARFVLSHLAHRMIARERAVRAFSPAPQTMRATYSGAALWLAWLSGFAFGIFTLFSLLTLLRRG